MFGFLSVFSDLRRFDIGLFRDLGCSLVRGDVRFTLRDVDRVRVCEAARLAGRNTFVEVVRLESVPRSERTHKYC